MSELKHRYSSNEQYQNAIKLAEAACPLVFCKLVQGVAYYTVEKKEIANNNTFYYSTKHLLNGTVYNNGKSNVAFVPWRDIPDSYKLDALAVNEVVRTYFGNLYIHTSQEQNMNLSDKLSNSALQALANARGSLVSIANDGQSVKVYPSNYVAKPVQVDNIFEDLDRPYTTVDAKATAALINNNTNNKDNSMSFLNNIPGLNLDFGKFNSDAIALGFDMQPVFKTKQGGYAKVTEGKILEYQGDLKFDFDFYKVPVQANQLAVGDIILENGQLLIVDETAKGDIKFINPLTGNKSSTLVKTNILGTFFYTKIVSLFNLGQDGSATGLGIAGLNPMMLMLLSQKGEGVNSSSDLLPLLLMSQGGQLGGSGGINPMMLMMLSGNKGGSNSLSDLLPLMLLGGQGGANPLANLFGQAPAKVAAKRTTRAKQHKAIAAPKKVAAPVTRTRPSVKKASKTAE